MELQNTIKDESQKTELNKNSIIDFIEKEKAAGNSETVVKLAKQWINDNPNTNQDIGELYKALAEKYPAEKTQLLKLSIQNNKYVVNNTSGFLQNILNENENDYYKCRIFPPAAGKTLNFPCGTLSYLGARTSRGKTTAMISIIIDALQQNKKVAIITNEESTDEIQLRLIMALMYTNKDFKPKFFIDNPKETIKPLLKIIANAGTNLFNTSAPNENQVRDYLYYYTKIALNKLNELYTNERITIFDGLDAPKFSDTLNYIETLEEKTVIILDYIQHARTPAGSENQTRQVQIQETSHLLTDVIKRRNLICIAGAQFNRTACDVLKDGGIQDQIQDGLFRESGDIEQDGHICLGIGAFMKKGVAPIRYYSIFKNRNGGIDNKYYLINTAGIGFSFIAVQTNGKTLQEYETPKQIQTKNTTTTKQQNPKTMQDIMAY